MKATDGSGLRKRQAGFTQVPNETIFDEDLPNRALGILSKVLSLPNGWDLRTEWLLAKCPHEGRDAVMGALRTLRKLGYYRVERRRRPDGTFTTGVSASEIRVPEWAAQHAQACADQGTDKPKWDVSLRLLDDGRVEDEPIQRPELIDTNPQVNSPDGFSVSGEPVSGEPVTGEPVTGLPDVKERPTTKTITHSEGVSLVSSGDGEQPPLDAPDGTHRTCPEHRVIPAPGPCTPCGTYRRAWERAEAAADAEIAAQARQMVEEQRQHERRARELADAELRSCGLCDRTGRLPSGLVCLHDPEKNPRPDAGGFAEFQALRAKGIARTEDGRDPAKGRRRAAAERQG